MDRAPLPDRSIRWIERHCWRCSTRIKKNFDPLPLPMKTSFGRFRLSLRSPHRQILSQQDEELRSNSEQIEHLKLVIKKAEAQGCSASRARRSWFSLNKLELYLLEELESSRG